jgi:hypothetical protein
MGPVIADGDAEEELLGVWRDTVRAADLADRLAAAAIDASRQADLRAEVAEEVARLAEQAADATSRAAERARAAAEEAAAGARSLREEATQRQRTADLTRHQEPDATAVHPPWDGELERHLEG